MPEMAGNELRCLKKMSLKSSMSGREISSEQPLTSKGGRVVLPCPPPAGRIAGLLPVPVNPERGTGSKEAPLFLPCSALR